MPQSKEDLLQSCYTLIKDCLVLGYPVRELHADPEALLAQIEEVMPDIDKGEEDEWEDEDELDDASLMIEAHLKSLEEPVVPGGPLIMRAPEEDEDSLSMEVHLLSKVLG